MRELDASAEKQEVKIRRKVLIAEMELEILYLVSDDELNTLEEYSKVLPMYHSYSMFALGIAVSATFTLISLTPIDQVSSTLQIILWCITGLGYIIGITLIIIWKKSSKSHKELFQKIKKRYKGNSKDP